MPKALVVAQSEFVTLTRSKGFLIGILLMPILMSGAIFIQKSVQSRVDTADRRFAVIDQSGVLYPRLAAAAEEWNRATAIGGPRGGRSGPRFLPSQVPVGSASVDRLRLALSDRVRREDLFAFVEIPADVLGPDRPSRIQYHSNHPSYAALSTWIRETLNREILNHRFRTAALDQALVSRLSRPVPVEQLGLLEQRAAGTIKPAETVDRIRTFVVPGVVLFLLFIVVMSSSPQLLNSVVEEKMSRISEVMLGSVSPFQLMLGKLVGSAAVSLLLAFVYVGGALFVANYFGYGDAITPSMVAWFIWYLVFAIFLFGSIFIAIGAACTDLKDAQNLMTPAMLVIMLPMLTWSAVLRAPDSGLAIGLSLFPLSTPFLMLLRIALRPGPPFWQIALSVVLVALTTVGAVWAAAKIFRTGLLMQGKAATLGEITRWLRA